jgi:hypothetical protein
MEGKNKDTTSKSVIAQLTFGLWEGMWALKHENLTIVATLTQATSTNNLIIELHKERNG